jgi:hypothetical protein
MLERAVKGKIAIRVNPAQSSNPGNLDNNIVKQLKGN